MKNKDFLREKAEDLIAMSEGETQVKTYHCTTVNIGEYEGYITLTDRRLILVESSAHKGDCRKTELPLEAVGGIDYQYRHGVNTGKMCLGSFFFVVAAALALLPAFLTFANWIDYLLWSLAGVFLLITVVLFCVRTPSLFILTVYSSYPMTSFLGFASTTRQREEKFFIKPAADCQTMLRELGALVLDVRQFGAEAREKYLTKFEQKEIRAERKVEAVREKHRLAEEQEVRARLEEKQRRQRIKEQKRLEKESRKPKKDKTEPEEKSEQYFDILNK